MMELLDNLLSVILDWKLQRPRSRIYDRLPDSRSELHSVGNDRRKDGDDINRLSPERIRAIVIRSNWRGMGLRVFNFKCHRETLGRGDLNILRVNEVNREVPPQGYSPIRQLPDGGIDCARTIRLPRSLRSLAMTKYATKGLSLGLLLVLFAMPLTVLAQAKLQSSNYVIDDLNFASNNTLTTSRTGIPPAISSKGPQITNLTPTSATIEWETDKKSKSRIRYGRTTDYGFEVGTSELTLNHKVTISGLTEETTYHFIAESEDSFGGIGRSSDNTFTTPAQTQFKEVSVSRITYTEALITVVTGGLKKVTLDYGTSTAYGSKKEINSVTGQTEHNFSLTGLSQGTKYFFKLTGTDSKDNNAILSGLTFTTIAEPKLDSLTMVAASPNEIVITVGTNTKTSIGVAYKSNLDVKELTAADTNLALGHEIRLTKLYGATEYSIKVTATDEGGKRVTSLPRSVTTAEDKLAPEVTDPKVDITRGREIVATVKWEANEPVSGKLIIKSKINPADKKEIEGSGTKAPNQVIVATGLTPKTPYEIIAVSTDIGNNKTEKSVFVVTPSLRKSILELIMQNLEKVIGPIQSLLSKLDSGN